MVIRSEQATCLRDAAFELRVTEHLQNAHPTETARLEPPALSAFVRESMARGRGYGITSERGLAAFSALRLVVHREFDLDPRVQRILTDPGIPGNRRIDALTTGLSSRDWNRAAGARASEGV